MVEFRTLGGVTLGDPSNGHVARSILAGPKRVAILAYLAVVGRANPLSREKLLAMFWPEASDARARNALNQFVFVLRRGLGSSIIVSEGTEALSLAPESLWCDAVEFEELLERGEYEAALDLYTGEFLEGFHLDGCPTFERWLDAHRDRLRDRALKAALHLAGGSEDAGNPAGALPWYYRARELAPFDEALLRRMLNTLVQVGDESGAVREFDVFARRMSGELRMGPSRQLRELVHRIQERKAGSARTVSAPVPVDAVGRVDEAAAPESAPSSRGLSRSAWLRVGGVIVIAALVVAYLSEREPDPSEPLPPGRALLAVPPLTPATGADSSQIGLSAARVIAEAVSQSGLARVASPDGLVQIAASGGPEGSQPGLLAGRAGADFYVAGTYSEGVDSVRLRAGIVHSGTGDLRRAVLPVVVPRERLEDGLELLASRISAAVGTTVDPRFAEWAHATRLPQTLESYRRLSAAADHFVAGRHERAIEGFRAVAAAEPDLSLARVWAALALTRLWYHSGHTADSLRDTAEGLVNGFDAEREGLPSWDRAMLEYIDGLLAIDFPRAYAAVREAAQLAPGPIWQLELSLMCIWLDRPHELLDVLSRFDVNAEWLEPARSRYWSLALTSHHRLGNHERELELIRSLKAVPRLGRRIDRLEIRAIIALQRDEEVLAEFDLRMASDQPGGLMQMEPELRAHGYPGLADRAVVRIVDLLKIDRIQEAEVLLRKVGAESGRYLDALAELGILAAMRGQPEEALRISAELQAIPQVSLRTQYQAQIAAALGDRALAVSLLRQNESPARGPLHRELDFPSLLDYPPFQELDRPRG